MRSHTTRTLRGVTTRRARLQGCAAMARSLVVEAERVASGIYPAYNAMRIASLREHPFQSESFRGEAYREFQALREAHPPDAFGEQASWSLVHGQIERLKASLRLLADEMDAAAAAR